MRNIKCYRILARARKKYEKPDYPGKKNPSGIENSIVKEAVCEDRIMDNRNKMVEKYNNVWDKINDIIRNEISPVSYETWIEPCRPLLISDERIVLLVENELSKHMIENRYIVYLSKITEKVMPGSHVKIEVVTSSDKVK